jgi:hypothetical protein
MRAGMRDARKTVAMPPRTQVSVGSGQGAITCAGYAGRSPVHCSNAAARVSLMPCWRAALRNARSRAARSGRDSDALSDTNSPCHTRRMSYATLGGGRGVYSSMTY